MLKILVFLAVLLITFSLVQAQDSCPAIVESTITVSDSACGETGRNQACYGHVAVEAEPQPDVSHFVFDHAGDIVDVADIQNLQLGGMNIEMKEWGIVILRVQANLPDTLPGQNVQIVLFGDVELRPTGEFEPPSLLEPKPVTLQIRISGGLNVRSGPSTSHAVVGGLSSEDVVTAVGRNATGDWLQILVSEDDEDTGWVYTPLVTVDGDPLMLPVARGVVTTPEVEPTGSLQAFYFQTGISSPACREAPNGLMIQTPEGVGEISLVMNDVIFNLGSTAYLKANADELLAMTLEGSTRIKTSAGTDDYVPPGAQLRITDDKTTIEPFDEEVVSVLPIGLLDREIKIPSAVVNICNAENPIFQRQVDPSDINLSGGDTRWYFLPAGTSLTLQNSGGTRIRQGGYITILDRREMVPVGDKYNNFYNKAAEYPVADSGNSRTLTITVDRNLVFFITIAYAAGDDMTLTATCS